LALACLALAGCQEQERRIPVSTTSEEARELFLQGREALDMLRPEDARSYFAQAVEADPHFAMAHLALSELATTEEAARESLRRALAETGSVSEGERLLILAAEAATSREGATQLDHYLRAALLYPDDERILIRLGDYYIANGNYSEGALRYIKALDLAPDFTLPHLRMGQTYRTMGRYDHAAKALVKFCEQHPEEPNPHALLAELQMKAGKFEDSIATYEKVLGMDPSALSARVGIAHNLLFLDRKEESRAAFRELVDKAGDDEQRRVALVWMAAAHLHDGDREQALQELQRAYELAESDQDVLARAETLDRIGNVLLESGDQDGAMSRFAEAYEIIRTSEVSHEVKSRAERDLIYYETRVAITEPDRSAVWEKVSEYRSTSRQRYIPGVKERFNELGARAALAVDNHEMALRKVTMADQGDPRVLLLTALAQRAAGDVPAAKSSCTAVVNFNEALFELALVRGKAEKLLAELES
jgi:tetratricopeptide (TPR) repeat protein